MKSPKRERRKEINKKRLHNVPHNENLKCMMKKKGLKKLNQNVIDDLSNKFLSSIFFKPKN